VNFRSCCRNRKTAFTGGPYTIFAKLRRGPWFTKISLDKSKSSQCSPWADCPHRRPKFPAGEHRTWPAEGLGRLGSSLLTDSCRRLDRGRCRRAPVAWRPWTAHRCCCCSAPARPGGSLGARKEGPGKGRSSLVVVAWRGKQDSAAASANGERRRYWRRETECDLGRCCRARRTTETRARRGGVRPGRDGQVEALHARVHAAVLTVNFRHPRVFVIHCFRL
jgi:hypothetical protein